MSAEVLICDIPHKIGAKGLVFMKIDGDWVRSTKKPSVVVSALNGGPVKKRKKREDPL